jgi:hypothetical protein
MPLPINITQKTITGEFVDYEGNPIEGQVKFTVNSRLRDALTDQILIPSVKTVTIDSTGHISTTLMVTDDPDFHLPFQYVVEESFTNGKTYNITIPTAGAATFDLSDLRPEDTSFETFFTPIAAGQWGVLEADVTAEEVYWDAPNETAATTTSYRLLYAHYLTYDALAADHATYGALDGTPPLFWTNTEVTGAVNRVNAIIAYNNVFNQMTVPAEYPYLPAKYNSYTALAAAYATYAAVDATTSISLTANEVGSLMTDIRRALGLTSGAITNQTLAELPTYIEEADERLSPLLLMGV